MVRQLQPINLGNDRLPLMKPAKLMGLCIAGLGLVTVLLFPVLTTRHKDGRRSLPPAMQAKLNYSKLLLDEGRQARRDGDLVTAKAKLQQCLAQHTIWDDIAAKELGRIYEQQSQPDRAFAAYQQAFNPTIHSYSDFPNDVEALARYGLRAEQRGQWAEAVRVYEQARERLNPKPSIALNFDPQVEPTAQHLNFDPQAEPTALQLSQLRAMLNVARGIALDEQAKSQDALAAYAEAVRLQPRQAVAQYYLGYGLQ